MSPAQFENVKDKRNSLPEKVGKNEIYSLGMTMLHMATLKPI